MIQFDVPGGTLYVWWEHILAVYEGAERSQIILTTGREYVFFGRVLDVLEALERFRSGPHGRVVIIQSTRKEKGNK